MYESPPSEAEMATAGLTAKDFASEVVEVWPENEPAYFLFNALGTQWRIGMAGPTGLDHNVLLRRLDRMSLEPDEYDQLDADVRLMESEALSVMHSKD